MCFPISVQLLDNVLLTVTQSGIMWFIFIRFLFFSMTFSFVTPFFFNFGSPRVQPDTPEKEYGECSWYGSSSSTLRLPNGQLVQTDGFTAAHRTLPLGSPIVVTNADNGKSVTVRVTDRGPLVYGRIAALSQSAFEALGADLDQKVFPCFVSPRK